MTQDEIIEMAREAGLDPDLWNYTDAFESFAKLVDAKATAREREACAKVCDTYEDWSGPWGQYDNLYAAIESANEIAKAIRARGEAT